MKNILKLLLGTVSILSLENNWVCALKTAESSEIDEWS